MPRREQRVPLPDLPALDGLLDGDQVAATARAIGSVQEPTGAIPWFPGGHVDPWDHVECAMALSVGGRVHEATRAYDYLRRTQAADGSWPRKVVGGVVVDAGRETNQCAYVAVGVWHHLLVTGDERFAWRMWPTVRRALDFVVSHQTDRGEIRWSVDDDGVPADAALLTGSSSTYQSLRCGLALAAWVGEAAPEWELAAGRLGHVVRAHPEAFLDKSRFSMDWYYPVLAGPVRGPAAQDRFDTRWQDFVVGGLGARCVDDEPWVTGAETCELVLALDAAGDRDRALALLADVQHLRTRAGAYWTGYQFAERIFWPDEQSTWTAAAVVLATDALSRCTPGNGIFRGDALPQVADLPDAACGCDSVVRASQDA
jgi:hypothetical protein